jgi:hypothetical protein
MRRAQTALPLLVPMGWFHEGVEPIRYTLRLTTTRLCPQEVTMNSPANIMPIEAEPVRTSTFKQRLSSFCFLTAVTVAMIGWLSAFGWVAVAFANWVST